MQVEFYGLAGFVFGKLRKCAQREVNAFAGTKGVAVQYDEGIFGRFEVGKHLLAGHDAPFTVVFGKWIKGVGRYAVWNYPKIDWAGQQAGLLLQQVLHLFQGIVGVPHTKVEHL